MTLAQFSNAIRTLWNIDRAEYLACINAEDREFVTDDVLWKRFRDEPHRTFCFLPDQDQARVFAVIEARNEKAGL